MLSLYLRVILAVSAEQKVLKYLPFVVDSFDNKSKGWTDAVHILSHDPLYNGCLSCVIEPSIEVSSCPV